MADIGNLPVLGQKPWDLTPIITAINNESTATAATIATGRLSSTQLGNSYAPTSRTKTPPVGQGEIVLNVRDYGAVGDGTTDDGAAFRNALADTSSKKASVVRVPRGTYYIELSSALTPPAGVTLRGDGIDQTTLLVDAATPGAYSEAFNFNNDRVGLEYITLKRASDFPAVLIPVGAVTSPRMHQVKVDGQRGTFTSNYVHGLQVGRSNSGSTNELRVTECVFTGLVYGLFQTNASTATLNGLKFYDCEFAGNFGTDLEFNSPVGNTKRVRVENCVFTNNQTVAAGAGFAVGLAHIVDAQVKGCDISGYANEAIHVEDYSSDVLVSENTINNSGTGQGSVVQVISGSTRVKIERNQISTAGNTTSIYAINVLAGGTGTTPGGRTVIPPTLVSIIDNELTLANTTKGIYLESTSFCKVDGNKIKGPGNVSGGNFGGAFSHAMNFYASASVTVTNNTVNGFTYGVFPRSDGIPNFGDNSVFSGNVFLNCLLGAGITGSGAILASGNVFRQCVYPLIMGQGTAVQGSATVSSNQATSCTNPMQIYGVSSVRASAAATTGTGKTVTMSALPNVFPTGTVVRFSGGGILTLTTASNFQSTSMVGNLTGANVSANEMGIAYSPFSTDSTKNRTLSDNSDDFYGASGFGLKTVQVSSAYSVMGYEDVLICSGAPYAVTLPPAGNHRGQKITTLKNASASGSITVSAVSGNVEGSASLSVPVGSSVGFISDGNNWWSV